MSTALTDWRTHVAERVSEAVETIPPAVRSDVYVVQLTAWPEDDDGRRPAARIAWNTSTSPDWVA